MSPASGPGWPPALPKLPATADAVAEGTVGVAEAGEIAKLHTNPRIRSLVEAAEEELVEEASRVRVAEFGAVCRRFADAADADGASRNHDIVHERRNASTYNVGDEWLLRAHGSTLAGKEMSEILRHFLDAEFVADCDAAGGEYWTGQKLPRTAKQRAFDALLALFRSAACGTSAERRPQVVIHCDEHTFDEAFTGWFAGDPPPISLRRKLCETAEGLPVDPRQAIVAAIYGAIRRVLVDSTGLVIDYGRARRVFTGAARQAVLAGGRRCIWPGCEHTAGHLDIDHSRPWTPTDGGPPGTTSADNGAPMCPYHNRFKNRGYDTHRDEHGHWHTYRPDGSEVAPRHPAA